MGFTDFPHALSIDALVEAYGVIERDGDLAAMHFDSGIPWPEALSGAPYAQQYLDELNGKAGIVPDGHVVYLAITPISFGRDGLAVYHGATANEPLPAPWDGYGFDEPDVIKAFIAHAKLMIDLYSPDYFAYAIEANALYDNRPEDWPAFLALAEAVYTSTKASHPELPVFVTLQAEWFHRDPTAQADAITQLLPFTDLIALSSYPFIDELDADEIPETYFSEITALAPDKPFAIAETSWPAENVDDPYPVVLPGSEDKQRLYVERLLNEAEELDAEFVTWFFTRDFDDQWDNVLVSHPSAPTLRLWKDTGLYDGEGTPRAGLSVWLEALANSRN